MRSAKKRSFPGSRRTSAGRVRTTTTLSQPASKLTREKDALIRFYHKGYEDAKAIEGFVFP